MRDILMNHKLTSLLRSDVLGPDSRIISEEDGITDIVDAYKNIEGNLKRRGIQPISRSNDSLDDIIQSHLTFGNSAIHNMSSGDENKFVIYMPENINSLDKNIIKGFIRELSDVDDITLYQQVGESHECIGIGEFLQPKVHTLYTTRQNNNLSDKKGLNIQ